MIIIYEKLLGVLSIIITRGISSFGTQLSKLYNFRGKIVQHILLPINKTSKKKKRRKLPKILHKDYHDNFTSLYLSRIYVFVLITRFEPLLWDNDMFGYVSFDILEGYGTCPTLETTVG